MPFFIISFLFLFTLFAIEKFYFKERFGGFAMILCVFVIQMLLMLGSGWILSDYAGSFHDSFLGGLFAALGALALLTIGLTPIFAAVCVIVWVLVKAGDKLFSDRSNE